MDDVFELSFVDSIAASPVVRLDINDGNVWVTMAGTDFGMPQLRRSVSSTTLADGDHIAASAYGDRMIKLVLDLSQVPRDEAAAQIQLLSREINRSANFLRYRPGTTHPVWFRTKRGDYDSLDWDAVLQRATVRLPAEPFAFGLPETLPTVTVRNDPAAIDESGHIVEDFEDTNFNVTITNGGNAAWARNSAQFHAGAWSFKSGTIVDGQTSDAIVTVPSGKERIRFWYKVSSEANFDFFRFLVGANLMFEASGEVGWKVAEYDVSGAANVTFRYIKDGSQAAGSDAAWIDDLEFYDVTADPNPMFLDVTGVKGDVDAATKIDLDDTASPQVLFGRTLLIATRRRGTPSELPFAFQAEDSPFGGQDTDPAPFDPAMSGASNNYVTCDFSGVPSMEHRYNLFEFPGGVGVDHRGVYRVLARMRHTVAADVIDVELRVETEAEQVTISSVRMPADTNIRLFDMGLIQVPFGVDPVTDGPSGVELEVSGYNLRLYAARVSGTGNLDIDYVLAIPADDQLALIDLGQDVGAFGWVLDSHHDMVYPRDIPWVEDSHDSSAVGALPTLRPGVINRIYLVQGVGDQGGSGITEDVPVTITYWPRYLFVRPVST